MSTKKTITTNKRQKKVAKKATKKVSKKTSEPKVESPINRKELGEDVFMSQDELFRLERISLKEERERALMATADQQLKNIELSRELLLRDIEVAKNSQTVHGRNLNQLRAQKINLVKEIAVKYNMGGKEFGYDPDSGKLIDEDQLKT